MARIYADRSPPVRSRAICAGLRGLDVADGLQERVEEAGHVTYQCSSEAGEEHNEHEGHEGKDDVVALRASLLFQQASERQDVLVGVNLRLDLIKLELIHSSSRVPPYK